MISPFLSVVVPAHDAADYLGEALDSILAQGTALGAGRSLEVIVVDDASRDATASIVQSYATKGVRLRSRSNQGGAGAARNMGIAAAEGELLGFLDADDLWSNGRLQPLLAALGEADSSRIAFGQVRPFACPRMDPDIRRRLRVPHKPMAGYCAGAMLLRRADFNRVGPFAETIKVGEFIDWFARARDAGLEPALVGDVVLERRIHGANLTVQNRQDYRDYAHVLKRALDRRRPGQAS